MPASRAARTSRGARPRRSPRRNSCGSAPAAIPELRFGCRATKRCLPSENYLVPLPASLRSIVLWRHGRNLRATAHHAGRPEWNGGLTARIVWYSDVLSPFEATTVAVSPRRQSQPPPGQAAIDAIEHHFLGLAEHPNCQRLSRQDRGRFLMGPPWGGVFC